jgi:hypothetical protein
MSLNPFWPFFHCREKQNKCHYKSYSKGCVHHYVMEAKLQDVSDELEEPDAAAAVLKNNHCFDNGAWNLPFIIILCH